MVDINETNNQNTVEVGRLTLNFQEGWVKFDNQYLNLTTHEYKFISLLANNLGCVITEAELLTRIWTCGENEAKSQVKNLVWRLRQKLEPNPETPLYILTARGHGYLMPTKIGETKS